MAEPKSKAKKQTGILIGGVVVIVAAIFLYERHKSSVASSNATTAAANPNSNLITVQPNNATGIAQTTYSQALANEAALSAQLSTLESQPGSTVPACDCSNQVANNSGLGTTGVNPLDGSVCNCPDQNITGPTVNSSIIAGGG